MGKIAEKQAMNRGHDTTGDRLLCSVSSSHSCTFWSRDWVEKSNDSYKNDKRICPGPAGPFQVHLQVGKCVHGVCPHRVVCDSGEEKGTGTARCQAAGDCSVNYEKRVQWTVQW